MNYFCIKGQRQLIFFKGGQVRLWPSRPISETVPWLPGHGSFPASWCSAHLGSQPGRSQCVSHSPPTSWIKLTLKAILCFLLPALQRTCPVLCLETACVLPHESVFTSAQQVVNASLQASVLGLNSYRNAMRLQGFPLKGSLSLGGTTQNVILSRLLGRALETWGCIRASRVLD